MYTCIYILCVTSCFEVYAVYLKKIKGLRFGGNLGTAVVDPTCNQPAVGFDARGNGWGAGAVGGGVANDGPTYHSWRGTRAKLLLLWRE